MDRAVNNFLKQVLRVKTGVPYCKSIRYNMVMMKCIWVEIAGSSY